VGGHNGPKLGVHSGSQSLPFNLHPIPCHPEIECIGTGYKFPGLI